MGPPWGFRVSLLGYPCPRIYRWKPGVATWARVLPKVGFGHKEESNPDSRGKRRGLWHQGKTPGTMAFPPVPQGKSVLATRRSPTRIPVRNAANSGVRGKRQGPWRFPLSHKESPFPRLGEFYNPPDTSISSREPSGTSQNISGSPETIFPMFHNLSNTYHRMLQNLPSLSQMSCNHFKTLLECS